MHTYGPYAVSKKSLCEALRQPGIGQGDVSLVNEMRGGQGEVFQVRCEQEQSTLAVRVSAYMDPKDMIETLKMELQNLRLLTVKGFPWAPRCYGYSLTFDNAIRLPFLVLEWEAGSNLHWTEISPQRPQRDRVLAQLASIQVALIECTFEPSLYILQIMAAETMSNFPTLDCLATRRFFERLLLNRRTRVEEGQTTNLTVHDCDVQRELLPLVLGPHCEETGLAMDHGDLQPSNIIVDEDYNITG